MKQLKKTLIVELEKQLVPKLESFGFTKEKSRSIEIDGYSKAQFPLPCFIRYDDDENLQLIEIRFSKDGEPKFEFRFCRVKAPRDYHAFGLQPQENATVTNAIGHYGVLQKSKIFTFKDFSLRRKNSIDDKTIAKFVTNIVEQTNQIEAWFVSGLVSKQMRTIENFNYGASITRGYPKFLFLREVACSFMVQLDGVKRFNSKKDVREFLKGELADEKRFMRFGTYWPWQKIYTH